MNKDAVLDLLELCARVGLCTAVVGAVFAAAAGALHLVGVPLAVASAALVLCAIGATAAAIAGLSRRSVRAMTFRSPQH